MSYKMSLISLALSWAVSRGRDTYGYNIARLDDTTTGKRYKTCGGGYDMTGTVFGEWLQETYQERLKGIYAQAYSVYRGAYLHTKPEGGLYGMRANIYAPFGEPVRVEGVSLDGACGIESMIRIAEAIGLEVQRVGNRKGHTTGFIVEDVTKRVYDNQTAALAGSKGAE